MDKILVNGICYTMDKENPVAEAIAIDGNIIKAVGSEEEIRKLAGPETEIIDCAGGMIIPGIIDSHNHPSLAAVFAIGTYLGGPGTMDELLAKVKADVEANPDAESYFAYGYDETTHIDYNYNMQVLDEISPDKPLLIIGASCHVGWGNSKLFELAGIDENTPDPIPEKSYFRRNAEGKLTGLCLEGPALGMIVAKSNIFSLDSATEGYKTITNDFSSVGVTTLGGCGDFHWMAAGHKEIKNTLIHSGEFNQRIFDCAFVESPDQIERAFTELEEVSKKYDDDLYRVNVYKIMLDGTIETQTAAMSEPTPIEPEFPAPLVDVDTLSETFIKAAGLGYNLHAHAIGNCAVNNLLDAAAAVRKAGYTDNRIICAHSQLVEVERRPQFKELDVVHNTTGGWQYYFEGMEEFLGYAYAIDMRMREIIEAGATVTFASDRPADGVGYDPRIHIATAVTGLDELSIRNGLTREYDYGMTVMECLEAYTRNGAYALQMDDKIGTLKAGYYADVAVFEKDMTKLAPAEILDDSCLYTIFNGKMVYQK